MSPHHCFQATRQTQMLPVVLEIAREFLRQRNCIYGDPEFVLADVLTLELSSSRLKWEKRLN